MMVHNLFKSLCVLSVAVMLHGCINIQFPQVNSLIQNLNQPEPAQLDKFTWFLTNGNYKAKVYLVNIGSRQVFVSEKNDVLTFGKDKIIAVNFLNGRKHNLFLKDLNLPTQDNTKITGISGDKPIKLHQFLKGEKILNTFECVAWSNVTPLESQQECTTQNDTFVNKRVLNKKGELIYFEQWFAGLDAPLLLQKML